MPLSMIVVHRRTSASLSQEAVDPILEVTLLHLAVGDHHAHLGHDALEHLLDGTDRPHAVVEEEDLAPAPDLAQDGLADQALVEA